MRQSTFRLAIGMLINGLGFGIFVTHWLT